MSRRWGCAWWAVTACPGTGGASQASVIRPSSTHCPDGGPEAQHQVTHRPSGARPSEAAGLGGSGGGAW